MKKLLVIPAMLVCVSLLFMGAVPLVPYQHNFFTTNQSPVVDVLSGSPNVTVTPSAVGTDTRHFTVSVSVGSYDPFGAAHDATNGFPWLVLSDPVGTATTAANNATNGFPWGVLYDSAGLAASKAHDVTNGYPWLVLSDVAGAAHDATNGFPWGVLYDSAGTATHATNDLSGVLKIYTQNATNDLNTVLTGKIREILTAARTYYVATTGSDSANGLAVGTPFLTIQHALNVVGTLDTALQTVTIQIADGTYAEGLTAPMLTGGGSLLVQGNSTTPANVVLAGLSGLHTLTVGRYISVSLLNFKIQGVSGHAINCTGTCRFSNLIFGAVTGGFSHISAGPGGYVLATGNYSISGGSGAHIVSNQAALVFVENRTITISGTPAFSLQYLSAANLGIIYYDGNTFSGSATGTRYFCGGNAVIYVNTAVTSYLPGNVNGSTATGGQYQ